MGGEANQDIRLFTSNDTRMAIYHALLEKSHGGKLKKGVTKMVASAFSVSLRTVQRIWKHHKDFGDFRHRKTENCGRKRVQINLARFRAVPLLNRTTFSSLSETMDISQSTLCRKRKSGEIRRHSSSIKPYLRDENKKSRLRFCLSMLEDVNTPENPVFKGMYNVVHVDEKWFFMTKKNTIVYLTQDEDDPHRMVPNKNFIKKIMFLVAVARPRYDSQGNLTFNGKIGVWPFAVRVPARRTSVNRVAGTLETKPILSVTREVNRSFFIEKLLPAIREKWPREDLGNPIFIQQDNASPHLLQNDLQFVQAATQDGFDIRLMNQPPNSPDFNVLDLGFFRAIQAIKDKESTKTYDELIGAVLRAYEIYPSHKINRIFLTFQTCMIEVMKAMGSNRCKLSFSFFLNYLNLKIFLYI